MPALVELQQAHPRRDARRKRRSDGTAAGRGLPAGAAPRASIGGTTRRAWWTHCSASFRRASGCSATAHCRGSCARLCALSSAGGALHRRIRHGFPGVPRSARRSAVVPVRTVARQAGVAPRSHRHRCRSCPDRHGCAWRLTLRYCRMPCSSSKAACGILISSGRSTNWSSSICPTPSRTFSSRAGCGLPRTQRCARYISYQSSRSCDVRVSQCRRRGLLDRRCRRACA